MLAGLENTASGYVSGVVAGSHNTASEIASAVVGGVYNKAEGKLSVVLGGGGTSEDLGNVAGGDYTVVGGGQANKVYGHNSIVLGTYNEVGAVGDVQEKVYILGHHNKIGSNSFVLGSNVDNADVDNAVVLGDKSTAVKNAISVGSSGGERQIKFVKAGTDANDAVNLGQLTATAGNKANLDADNLTPVHVGKWQDTLGVDEKLNISVFDNYKGEVTTALGKKVDNTAFDTYKVGVNTALDNKVDNTTFNTYQGQVNTNLGKKADKTALTAVAKATSSDIDVAKWKDKLGVNTGGVDISGKADVNASNITGANVGKWQNALGVNEKLNLSAFDSYKADVNIALGNKVDNATFNTYQGQVDTNLGKKADKTALTAVAKATSNDIDVAKWKDKLGVNSNGVDVSGKANVDASNINNANVGKWQAKLGMNDKVDTVDFSAYKTQMTADLGKKVDNSAFTAYQSQVTTGLNSKADLVDFTTYKTKAEGDLKAVAKATSSDIDVAKWKDKLGVNTGGVDVSGKANVNADNITGNNVDKWQNALGVDEKLNISVFDTYKADVNTALDKKVDNTAFDTYKDSVNTALDKKVNNSDFSVYQNQVTANLNTKVSVADFTAHKTQAEADLKAVAQASSTDINVTKWKEKLGVNAGGVDISGKADKTALTAVAKATSNDIDVAAWKAKLGVGSGGGSNPVDLAPYAKTADVDTKLAGKVDNTDFSNYQTQLTADLGKKADKTDLATLASKDAANLSDDDAKEWKQRLGVGAGGADLSKFAEKAEVEAKISGQINDTEERAVKGKVVSEYLRDNYASKGDVADSRQAIINNAKNIHTLEEELSGGIAATAAMESAPYVSGKWTYAAGAAYYNGESAIGATLRRTAENGHWSMTAGAAASTQGEALVRVGVSGVLD